MTTTAPTTNAMTGWVGRTRRVDDLIAPFQTAGMAAMLDYPEPPGAGDALPPGWHWLFFADLPRQSALGPDGHEQRGDFLPPIPLPRRMWAGNRLAFHRPLEVGERARRDSEIVSVSEKQGRQGPLAFVTVHHTCSGAGAGGVALEEWHDIVYRGPARPGDPPPRAEAAPMAAKWRARGGARRDDAVPLFGADLQRPPHPLRPSLRHRRGRLSRPCCPRSADGDAACSTWCAARRRTRRSPGCASAPCARCSRARRWCWRRRRTAAAIAAWALYDGAVAMRADISPRLVTGAR